MSLIISLVPLAVAIGASLTAASVGVLTTRTVEKQTDTIPAVETMFMDEELLLKTLLEHGLSVNQISDQEYTVETEAGTLRYVRESQDVPFRMEASGIQDVQALLDSVDALEHEYGRNVQKFTYDQVMQGLAEHGMSVAEEEILEDDSILLTLELE